MADDGSARTKQQGLQQAASVIFALVAVVPLLIFAWTLHALGAIRSTQAQFSLGLALAVALLGFWMFRSLLSRMAEVVKALTAALEQAVRTTRRTPASTPAPSTPAPAAAGTAASTPEAPAPVAPVTVTNGAPAAASVVSAPVSAKPDAVTAQATVFASPTVATSRPTVAARPAEHAVAGIGQIRELSEVMQTMDALWHREATAHLNHRVQISVANSREPLVGTLSEATSDGLILEQPDGPLPIAYGRVTSIDRLA